MSGSATQGSTVPVAIVIVTWNSADYIGECLTSIAALTRRPTTIVVVDNGSSDATVERVMATGISVDLARLDSNTGFCHAANLGIARTETPIVLVLNPDTRLTSSFLDEVLPAFDEPRVGLATGKLLRFDGVTIDSAGQSLARSRQPIDRGYGERDVGQYDHDEHVFGVCGAAAVYRREMIADVAKANGEFYDEAFFAFYEDLDVAWRAKRFGWIAAYRHRAVAFHARGGSASHPGVRRKGWALLHRPPEIRYHIIKNRQLAMVRNDSWRGYLRNFPFVIARDAVTMALTLFTCPTIALRLVGMSSLFARALDLRRRDVAIAQTMSVRRACAR